LSFPGIDAAVVEVDAEANGTVVVATRRKREKRHLFSLSLLEPRGQKQEGRSGT
jgi:HSP20 family molecular chaperone IbpA